MTGAEWRTSTDLRALSRAAPRRPAARPLALLACGYGERVGHLLPAPVRRALAAASDAVWAGGPSAPGLLDLVRLGGAPPPGGPLSGLCLALDCSLRFARGPRPFVGSGAQLLAHAGAAQLAHPDPGADWRAPAGRHGAAWAAAFGREEAAHADLLRDVLGGPLRAGAFDPVWRTETAVLLARHMGASRDFEAMPILADALQDAGCDDDEVLRHCRDEGATHVRGCWVVDLVLGKE